MNTQYRMHSHHSKASDHGNTAMVRPVMGRFFFCLLAITLPLSSGRLALAQDGGETSREAKPDPAGQAKAAAAVDAAKQRIKKTGESSYELGDIKFDSQSREIRFPAVVNMTDGMLEYAIVTENGKTHESLLRTTISPTELNLVMLLCNYEPHVGEAAKFIQEPQPQTKAMIAKPMEKPGANQLLVDVEWKNKEAQMKKSPLASWIVNKENKDELWTNHWTYTGSIIAQVGYTAEYEGSIMATYFDMLSIYNCPVAQNTSDEVWLVKTASVPAVETPVTVILSPTKLN